MKKENNKNFRNRDMRFKDFEETYLIPYNFVYIREGKGSHKIYGRIVDNQIVEQFPIPNKPFVSFCLVAQFKRRFIKNIHRNVNISKKK